MSVHEVKVKARIDTDLLDKQRAWLYRHSCDEAEGLIGIVDAITDAIDAGVPPLTMQDLSVILIGLRFLQGSMQDLGFDREDFESEFGVYDVDPPTIDEIEVLCERINCEWILG